ncbi:unnamed protein product, partial [marine sediment metagenome]
YNLAKKKEFSIHYMDLLPTSDLNGFVHEFGTAVLKTVEERTTNWIKKIGQVFKTIRPIIKIDSLSGQPSISFDFRNKEEILYTLEEIFSFLKSFNKKVVIAMDEFQQIGKNNCSPFVCDFKPDPIIVNFCPSPIPVLVCFTGLAL